jgi:hypothetical protein
MRWLSLVGFIFLASCRRDPTPACNPSCLNGGVCVGGVCQCFLPFEGPTCTGDVRDKFLGVWEGRRTCNGTQGGLRYTTWKDSLTDRVWIAGSFYGQFVDTLAARPVEPTRLQIPLSLLRDTTLSVEGWATQQWDSLLINLRVIGSGGEPLPCTWELKRR